MKPFDNARILLCDNHILVIDKPAGLAVQPDVCDLAKAWVKHKFDKPGNVFLEPIHRLDKPVSGLVLFARTSKALSRLQQEMRNRGIVKIYHAWVEGRLKETKGELRHHLLHASHRAIISPQGKEAILEYEVLEEKNGKSFLRIQLHTGRYHQIRAQLSHFGYPIVGDQKYGSSSAYDPGIALRATHLNFIHPVSKEPVKITLPTIDPFSMITSNNI